MLPVRPVIWPSAFQFICIDFMLKLEFKSVFLLGPCKKDPFDNWNETKTIISMLLFNYFFPGICERDLSLKAKQQSTNARTFARNGWIKINFMCFWVPFPLLAECSSVTSESFFLVLIVLRQCESLFPILLAIKVDFLMLLDKANIGCVAMVVFKFKEHLELMLRIFTNFYAFNVPNST